MARSFTSYAIADKEFADEIAEGLRERNHRILSAEIEPGESFKEQRISQLSQADVIVAIISEASTASP
jgi:nucleoside 2-deoxyribosyltransferase